jgi:hypothetical protein
LQEAELLFEHRDQLLSDFGHVRVEGTDEARVVRETILAVAVDGSEDLHDNRPSASHTHL